jgi:hypothetical protein
LRPAAAFYSRTESAQREKLRSERFCNWPVIIFALPLAHAHTVAFVLDKELAAAGFAFGSERECGLGFHRNWLGYV